MQSEVSKVKQDEQQEAKSAHAVSSLVILAIVTGLLMIVGVSATFLFRTEEITAPVSVNPDAEITKELSLFPTIRFSYNPVNHRLLLVGHLLNITDRSKMLDSLQPLSFISDIDCNNVVIDELVWRDFNQTLAKNPSWKGITITSPVAGHFVVSGFLQTKTQASELSDYISQNFPYIDLLEKKIIVEEDLLNQINRELSEAGFKAVTATISGGDLTLSGSISQGAQPQFAKLCTLFKSVPGIRSIQVLVSEAGQKEAMIDISEKYAVSGFSKQGNRRSVVIGGRFLSVGDSLDGMYISSITDTTLYLEKDGVKYKIDFNR
jgi:type III secretion system YscD/HrpQ family protein